MSAADRLHEALRPLLRRRGVSIVILLTLALGVGVNAGIFSIFRQVLLDPVPVPAPEQLYILAATGPKQGMVSTSGSGGTPRIFSYPMLQDLRRIDAPHRGIAGFRGFGTNMAFDGRTVSGRGQLVTANYFEVLEMTPSLGRLFRGDEFEPVDAPDRVVLAHGYWTREFGADPEVLGRPLIVNGRSMEIIGVASPGFRGLNRFSEPDVFVPITHAETMAELAFSLQRRQGYWIYLFTRLADGAEIESVEASLLPGFKAILREVDGPQHEGVSEDWMSRFLAQKLELEPAGWGVSNVRDEARTPLSLLLAVTALVLLIACVNIANLMLATSMRDRGEVAVRMALGAGWRALAMRQLIQLLLLAFAGAALSLPLAWMTLKLVLWLLQGAGPMPLSASIDWSLAAVGVGLGLLAMALAGVVPLLHTLSTSPIAAIREQSGRGGSSRISTRIRNGLVGGQIALALSLLVVSGLFIQSLLNIARVDLGMDIDRVVTFEVSPGQNGYPAERSSAFFESMEQRLNQLPGVRSASVSLVPLLTDSNWGNSVSVEGFDAGPETDTGASYNEIGARYFDTLSIPLLAGRVFADGDRIGRPQVAIVNRAFAEKFGMGDDIVGKRMAISTGNAVELDIEIVGLVGDANYASLKDPPPAQFFVPMAQRPSLGVAAYYVRSDSDPAALMAQIRGLVAEFDPNLPVERIDTLRRVSHETVVVDRLMGSLASLFAGLATVLAAVGLFGALSFAIAQRSTELGLRAALGASPAALKRAVLGQALKLALVGIVIGIGLALLLGRLAGGLLYGVSTFDPLITVAATVVLTLVVLLAAWLPARRAAAVEPIQALRYE